MPHMRLLARFLVDYTQLKWRNPADDNETFLRAAYRSLLDREPDPAAREHNLPALRSGRLPRRTLLGMLFYSQEFQQLHAPAAAAPNRTLLHTKITLAFAQECRQHPRRSLHENFLEAVYRTLLLRGLDNDGRASHLPLLIRGQLSHRELVDSLLASPEYQQVSGLRMHPLEAAHRSRMALIREALPPARHIVDLGGAAGDQPEGALLAMGYPHHPRSITIVDLPPTDRIGNQWSASFFNETLDVDGTEVRYLYRSMTDLGDIADASADMIVSGESIEHISESDGDIICREAFRILQPGGSFCLDTPNALLTRLQSPDEFIHPEHKKEYYVHELREKLLAHGFTIAEELAVCPMPRSRQERRFDMREMVEHVGVGPDPEDGYMFFIRAVKPI